MPEPDFSTRVTHAGPGALLLAFMAEPSAELARILGEWRCALEANRLRAVYDVIPAYRSILIEYRPGLSAERIWNWARDHAPTTGSEPSPRVHEIPVVYGRSADRDELAARLGLPFDEVTQRHAQAEYTVAFLGFTAGFPYLLGLPSDLQTPRRERPRERIPARAVAIAGAQAGIYPSTSPGGWWVLGQTDAVLFDHRREPPALLSPGDSVRFRAVERLGGEAASSAAHETSAPASAAVDHVAGDVDSVPEGRTADAADSVDPALDAAARSVLILEAWPRSLSLQATPRHGVGHLGMAAAGALDPRAHAEANAILGNPRGSATLEAIGNPVALMTRSTVRAALTGGGLGAHLDGRPLRRWEAFDWPAGCILELIPDRKATGYTTYLGVAGGFSAESYRGSASTDVRAGVGGARHYLAGGDSLALAADTATGRGAPYVGTPRYPLRAILRIHRGPQHEDRAWRQLLGSSFRVEVLDRTGARLGGAEIAMEAHETISEGSPAGSVQVPPNGRPIILLADRGRTGGYAKPAVVDPRDQWRLAQARPGTEIWFTDAEAQSSATEPVHWNP